MQAKISTSETEIKALTDRLEASERLNEQLVQRNRDLEISAHLASQAPHAQPASTILHHASFTVLTCCVSTLFPCLHSYVSPVFYMRQLEGVSEPANKGNY